MSAEQKSVCFTFRSMPHLDPLKALVCSIFVSVTITVLFIVPYAANERYLGSTALRGLMLAVLACFFVANLAVCTFRITGRGQPESTPPRTWLVFPLLATIGISAAHIPIGDTTLGAVPLAIITLYGGFVANLIFVIGPLFSTREHAAMARKGNSPFILCKILFFFFQAVYFEMTRRFATPLIGVLFPCGCILMEFMVILVIRIAICRFYFEPKSAFVERLASGPSDRLGGERLVTTPSEIDSAPAVASICWPEEPRWSSTGKPGEFGQQCAGLGSGLERRRARFGVRPHGRRLQTQEQGQARDHCAGTYPQPPSKATSPSTGKWKHWIGRAG